jgi:hypothetical protein
MDSINPVTSPASPVTEINDGEEESQNKLNQNQFYLSWPSEFCDNVPNHKFCHFVTDATIKKSSSQGQNYKMETKNSSGNKHGV